MLYLEDDITIELNQDDLELFLDDRHLIYSRVEIYEKSFIVSIDGGDLTGINGIIDEIEYDYSSMVDSCAFDEISESLILEMNPEYELKIV